MYAIPLSWSWQRHRRNS